MYIYKGTSTLFLFLVSFLLHSQESSLDTNYVNQDIFSQIQDDSYGGDIDFYQDPSLHVLIDKSTRLNEKNGINGFRIQIYSGTGSTAREQASNVKLHFTESYTDIICPVYIDYQAPYFRVKIGDFRNRNEAYFIYQQIKEDFPTSYIVKSKINFPELDLLKEE